MSTDRELLELAAKAIGRDVTGWGENFDRQEVAHLNSELGPSFYNEWNPLTDDGDALRLAVKLRMSVTVFEDKVGIGIRDWGYCEYDVEGGDYCAATRRAIVRAAAAIAKEIP